MATNCIAFSRCALGHMPILATDVRLERLRKMLFGQPLAAYLLQKSVGDPEPQGKNLSENPLKT